MAGYGTDEELQLWLDENGNTIPATAPQLAVLRQRASDWLDAQFGHHLNCSAPTGGFDQERAWPRVGHVVKGQVIPDDVVPVKWVQASYRAAWLEGVRPGLLSGVSDPSRLVKRQKVEGIEREFFEPGAFETKGLGIGPVDPVLEGMIGSLLCPEIDGFGFIFESIGS